MQKVLQVPVGTDPENMRIQTTINTLYASLNSGDRRCRAPAASILVLPVSKPASTANMSKISCRLLSSALEKYQVDKSDLLTVMSAGYPIYHPKTTEHCRVNHRLFWDSGLLWMLHDSVPAVATKELWKKLRVMAGSFYIPVWQGPWADFKCLHYFTNLTVGLQCGTPWQNWCEYVTSFDLRWRRCWLLGILE